MKATNIIGYIIAMFLPIIWFTVLTDNTNEKHPIQVYVMCIVLFAGAGLLASKGFDAKNRMKWIGLSIAIGVVEAIALTLLV